MKNNVRASNRKPYYATMIYLIAFLIILFICGYLILSANVDSKAKQATVGSIDFSDGWTDAHGRPIGDLSRMDLLPDASAKEFRTIFHPLPDELPENMSLCFRGKHLYYSVWIDGEMIAQQVLPESGFYTKSDGAVWAFAPLKSSYAGKMIEIHYQLCYEKSAAWIDHLYIGSERGYLLTILSDRMYDIIISLLFILAAITFIAADFPMNVGKNKNHELLYLGLFSLHVGMFCFVETQTMQLFIGNERIMHVLSWMSQIMIPIPIFLYSDEAFGLKFKSTRMLLTLLSTVILIVLSILNYMRIVDFHEMKYVVHFTDILAIIVVLYAMVRYYVRNRDTVLKSMNTILRIFGMAVIALTGVIDLTRYYNVTTQDSASTIRIGIFVYILCFGAASLDKASAALRNSAKAEFITTLAYTDGLTGMGNRTAYKEKMAEMREKAVKVGVVMLDVNNLKKVNDGLGHEYGDKLLMRSADFIRIAFSNTRFDSYRIGGDEFVVLLYGDDTQQVYEQSRKKLTELCRIYNMQPAVKYEVSIASGYAEAVEQQANLDEVCRTADAIMYENKRQMKLEMQT